MKIRLFIYNQSFKVLCILFLVLIDSIFMNAGFSEETIHEVIQQADLLKKRVETMEQILKEDTKQKDNYRSLRKETDDLVQILEEVEKKSLMDRLTLGAELRTRFDWFEFNGYDNLLFSEKHMTSEKQLERIRYFPTNRLRLNLKAKLDDKLQIHSRLVYYRMWADDDKPLFPDYNLFNYSRNPTENRLKVERAYVDYFFEPFLKIPMAFTFGKIPSTDSMPSNYKENTPRKSTYASLSYDIESDAISLSLFLDHWIPLPNPSLRLIFLRVMDDNQEYLNDRKISNKKGIYRDDIWLQDEVNIYAEQIEFGFPGLLNDGIVILNHIFIEKATGADFRYDEDLYQLYNDSSGAIYVYKPQSVGFVHKFTTYIQANQLFGLPLDCFAGYGFVKSHAKDAFRFMFNPKALGIDDPPILARDAANKYQTLIQNNPTLGNALNAMKDIPPAIGLFNYDGESDHSGYGFHVGLCYHLFIESLKNPKIGIEYNQGSRYWFGINEGADDPFKKLNTHGVAWDLYYIQPLNNSFLVRLGYTDIQYDYDNGLAFYHGEPLPIDLRMTNFYLQFDARF